VVVTILLATPMAQAQAPPIDTRPKKRAERVDAATAAKAEEAFHDGRRLMAKRSTLDRGCAVLERSFDLQERGDTLLNLAECHRRQGKTATAYREFDEALDYALSADFKEAIEAAFVLRAELEAQLSTLTVNVPETTAKLPKLVVSLDGQPIPQKSWGQPVAQDPGPHAITATAEGHETFRRDIVLGAEKDTQSVVVELKPSPKPVAPPPPKPPAAERGIPFWVWPVGGAGIAALGVSAATGLMTRGAGRELDQRCGPERLRCPDGYDFEATRSRELTTFGLFTGFGVAGLALVGTAAGGIIFSLVTDADQAKLPIVVLPQVATDAGGLVVTGAF